MSKGKVKRFVARDVRCSNEYSERPKRATFELTDSALRRIVELANLCRDHDVSEVRRFDYSCSWEGEDPLTGEPWRTECDEIVVDATSFHFTALQKHSDEQFSTEPFSIQAVAKRFGIDFNPHAETAQAGMHYLLVVHGDVEPEVKGPYPSADARDETARRMRGGGRNDDNGIFRLDVRDGKPTVGVYTTRELIDMDEQERMVE